MLGRFLWSDWKFSYVVAFCWIACLFSPWFLMIAGDWFSLASYTVWLDDFTGILFACLTILKDNIDTMKQHRPTIQHSVGDIVTIMSAPDQVEASVKYHLLIYYMLIYYIPQSSSKALRSVAEREYNCSYNSISKYGLRFVYGSHYHCAACAHSNGLFTVCVRR